MTDPSETLDDATRRWLQDDEGRLGPAEERVLRHAKARKPISRDGGRDYARAMSFGDRLADRVAAFGGSWSFIIAFGVVLAAWTGINLTLGKRAAFDPYPFIFLNLVLSMLAAIQAPIIMMSQNRQAARDRLDAGHDYEVNLKAELEIMALHHKIDRLRLEDMARIVAAQDEQIRLLKGISERAPD